MRIASRTPGEGTRPTIAQAPGKVTQPTVETPGRGTRPTKGTSIRIKRSWYWQDGFHDHKFRTPESESRKWEYVCLNPVRYGLVQRPEDWPFGGEIFYDRTGGPQLIRGTPPLLETGILIEEKMPGENEMPGRTPGKGTGPTG